MKKNNLVLFACSCMLVWSCSSHKGENFISSKLNPSLKSKTLPKKFIQKLDHSKPVIMNEFTNVLKPPAKDNPAGIAIVDNKAEQNFSINCKKDTTITCAEGTKIFIPAEAFADEKNKNVSKVNFTVKEYYSRGDIVLAGLTTHADKKMLESGGMVYLTAKNETREGMSTDCHLKKDKNVELSFPTRKQKNGMQVFNGVKKGNTINWVLPAKPSVYFVPPPVIKDWDEEPPMVVDDVVEDIAPSTYNVVEATEPEVYDQAAVQEQAEFIGGMGDMMNYLKKNIRYPQMCSEANIQGKVFIEFVIGTDGEVADIKLKRGIHPELDKEAKRVIASFPKWKPARNNGKNVKSKYILPINFRIDNGSAPSSTVNTYNYNPPTVSDVVKSNVSRDEYVKEYVEKIEDINEVEQDQLEYYVMSSAKLGWINCDRFVGNQKTERLAVNETDKANTTVRMVFKNIKSVLGASYSNGEYVFSGFPSNEPVVIVGFKKIGNKNFVAMEETTSNSKTLSLSYKQVTLEELKATIEKLNGKSTSLAVN
jgi:TonB family protein